MDVQEALKEENKSLKSVIKTLKAENMALDQVCLQHIQENLRFRGRIILLEGNLAELEKAQPSYQPDIHLVQSTSSPTPNTCDNACEAVSSSA